MSITFRNTDCFFADEEQPDEDETTLDQPFKKF